MLFKLHYFCQSAGLNAMNILLGVYMANYSDATTTEIGLLYMLLPFISMLFRPIMCSMADRRQAHREFLIGCELMTAISFAPFVIIPYMGDEFHGSHARLCWYCLALFRIIGDIAFSGASSIGDALAINYATRIGTEFSIYRVWDTVAWMIFGVITGHLNEIWFLPKYAAGFMVLILASLVDALACYAWPKEYFIMVTESTMKKEKELHSNKLEQEVKGENKLGSQLTRSLMPKEVVWAHAKKQLWSLVTCSCFSSPSAEQTGAKAIVMDQHDVESANNAAQASPSETRAQDVDRSLDKRTQLQTLFLLIRRDPRVIGYLIVFVGTGAARVPLNFFFMSLSDICHTQNTCNFSQLAGYLQFITAFSEGYVFLHIKTIIQTVGRLNSLSIAFALTAFKYLFYGTVWLQVDPHWSLVPEIVTGAIFAIFLTMTVEMAHYFASEVEHLIPELVERGVIRSGDEASCEKLKLALAATMQGLTASANDGLGRGMGALIFGLIIDAYSYQTLWLVVGVSTVIMLVVLQLSNLLESCCHLKVGLGQVKVGAGSVETTLGQDLEMPTVKGGNSKVLSPNYEIGSQGMSGAKEAP